MGSLYMNVGYAGEPNGGGTHVKRCWMKLDLFIQHNWAQFGLNQLIRARTNSMNSPNFVTPIVTLECSDHPSSSTNSVLFPVYLVSPAGLEPATL